MANAGNGTYLVDRLGIITKDAAALAVEESYEKARRLIHELRRSYAGAAVASLLRQFEGVDKFSVRLSVTSEYDDNGGLYQSVSASIAFIELVKAPISIAHEADREDQIDQIDYLYQVTEEIEAALKEEHAWRLYEALNDDPGSGNEVLFTVKRADLWPLLACDPIDGRAVYDAVLAATQ